MKIVFLRHMPTLNNLSDTFIGRLDLDCDPRYISEHLKDFDVLRKQLAHSVAFYSSPLKRATHSMETVFPNQFFYVDERLIERDLGSWSNVSKQLVRELYPDAFYTNGRMNFLFTPEGGEPFDALIDRVKCFIMEMVKKYAFQDTITVMTHNGVITAAKCIASNNYIDTRNIPFQPYLTPCIIDYNGTDFKLNQ